MRVTIREHISIAPSELPSEIRQMLEGALTIDNPQRKLAEREHLYGADRIDPQIRLFSYEQNGTMLIPIGFFHALTAGCVAMEIPIEIQDDRSFGRHLYTNKQIDLRDYQVPIVDALISYQVGVAEAPTAAGKTYAVLGAIQKLDRNALIIVEKMSLAQQWSSAVEEALGISCGFIGDGKWDVQGITVALRQSLVAKEAEIDERFYDNFGIVVVDEAHHAATAWTLIELIQRFSSVYRWGVTATPDRDKDYFPILQAVIGPVVWETTEQDAAEHLIIPTVHVIETDFEFNFQPTRRVKQPNGATKLVRNNYGAMMTELCADLARNLQIAQRAREEADAGHHVLIVSDRKEHLRTIASLVVTHIPYELYGGDDADEVRDWIYDAKKGKGTVTVSTIADEGLSINRFDRVIPAYPHKNPEILRQICGRVMRPYPGKTDAQVIDVRDGKQFLLRTQFQARAQQLYGKNGWQVIR